MKSVAVFGGVMPWRLGRAVRWPSVARFFATVLALALMLLSGCTSSSDPAPGGGGSYRFRETVQIAAQAGTRTEVTGGEFDATTSAYRMIIPEHDTLAETIITRTQLFMRPKEGESTFRELDPGTDWLGTGEVPGVEVPSQAFVGHPSPFDSSGLRRLARQESQRGELDLDGVPTRHYQLVLSVEDATQITRAGVPTPSSIAITFPDEPRVDIWVDDEGRIRRFRYEAEREGSPLVSITDFFDFDEAITVELPDSSRVTSLAQ